MANLVSPPSEQVVMVLKRTKILRIVAMLLLVPIASCSAICAADFAQRKAPSTEGAAIFGIFALAAAATLIWLFPREAALQLTLTDEGIEERSRAGRRQIPWSMVHEVWIRAVGVQVGGILGAGLAAAAEASRKGPRAGLSETSTNLHVRIVGPLGEIALTSNYRGVVAALAEVLDRVNPRLLEQALRQVKGGQTVVFGKLSVSTRGVGIGRAEPVPFTEIQKLSVEDSKVYLKKRGKWLSTGAGPAEKVPNLYVLMGLCEALSGGDIQTNASPDNGLTRRQIV